MAPAVGRIKETGFSLYTDGIHKSRMEKCIVVHNSKPDEITTIKYKRIQVAHTHTPILRFHFVQLLTGSLVQVGRHLRRGCHLAFPAVPLEQPVFLVASPEL